NAALTSISPLSLHDALPISTRKRFWKMFIFATLTFRRDSVRCQEIVPYLILIAAGLSAGPGLPGQIQNKTDGYFHDVKEALQQRSEEHTSLQSPYDLVCRLL